MVPEIKGEAAKNERDEQIWKYEIIVKRRSFKIGEHCHERSEWDLIIYFLKSFCLFLEMVSNSKVFLCKS
jgi:hypothetical protein